VFCANCSSKNAAIPKFGIEKEVRVCDVCFDKLRLFFLNLDGSRVEISSFFFQGALNRPLVTIAIQQVNIYQRQSPNQHK
jgi:hypothetical protein